MNTGFLPDLATDGFLDALGWLKESSEGRIPIRGPPLLTTEKDLFAVGGYDGHNDGGVGTWETEIGDAGAGGAGWSLALIDAGCNVLGRAGTLETGVDGERPVAA